MSDTQQFWKDALAPAPEASSPFWKPATAIGQGGTAEQARAFADEMVAKGVMTKEAADVALKAQGTEPTPVDTRGEEAKAFDATFAPAPPEAHRLDYIGRLPPGTQVATVAEFNSLSTQWLSEVGMPAGIGASVIERAMEVGQAAERMTSTERALWIQSQNVIFDRLAKTPERAAQLRNYAGQVIASAAKRADFSNLLMKSPGALKDATVLMNLALHGERLAARRGMK